MKITQSSIRSVAFFQLAVFFFLCPTTEQQSSTALEIWNSTVESNDLTMTEQESSEYEEADDENQDDLDATTMLITAATKSTTIKTNIPTYSPPQSNQNTNNHTNSSSTQYTNTSNPLVQFNLECNLDDTSFCNKVSNAVAAAIDEFSEVVNIKNSLLIYVKYYNFCESSCANDTYGWGAPTSQFTLPFEDGADLNYVYPQALAKQLAPYSSTSVWSKYDIEIEINHDLYMNATDYEQAIADGWNGTGVPKNGKYWFVNDTDDIQSDQIDLRYIILHQLLHGFGFVSSWAAYFWTDASPFRTLVDGVIDPIELQLVTPGPYWFINQNGGPAYVTGFQPTMIFDKYLINIETELNVTTTYTLSDLAFTMQDFCVQNQDAFIVNFIRIFNEANQSTTAHKLWLSMSNPDNLVFDFQPTFLENSSYNLIPYLNQTYHNMTLLTGSDIFSSSNFEHINPTLNRPGLMISHLDERYINTADFLMTKHYHTGQTLEQLTRQFYSRIPEIKYNDTASSSNSTWIEKVYLSPIGPGILRILDSIGYSTVLTKTDYTTSGNVKTPKSKSICDDTNSNPGIKTTPTPTSAANLSFSVNFISILLVYFLHSIFL